MLCHCKCLDFGFLHALGTFLLNFRCILDFKWPPSRLQRPFRFLLDTSKSCPVLRSGSIFAFWTPLESFCGVARALPGLLHDKLNRQRLPIPPELHSFCTAWLLNFMSMDIDRGKLVVLERVQQKKQEKETQTFKISI